MTDGETREPNQTQSRDDDAATANDEAAARLAAMTSGRPLPAQPLTDEEAAGGAAALDYARPMPRYQRERRSLPPAFSVIGLSAAAALFLAVSAQANEVFVYLYSFVTALAAVQAAVSRSCAVKYRPLRWALRTGLALGLLAAGVWVQRCPHRFAVYVGSFPVVDQGKQCGNGLRLRPGWAYAWDRHVD